MKRSRIKFIKLLSVLSLAAFFIGSGVMMQSVTAYAQSHEDEETDEVKPTVNAAISNGKLVVEAYDESGIRAIYVNDYEFTDVPDGRLSIRLQQFDVGYQEFTIKALDNAGNLSDEYTIENPYYSEEEDHSGELPADAEASDATEAKAEVKDYTEVKGDDDSVKVFYTFETENGKTFYLIIDRTENSEEVHFLTDVSESDLLNTTSDNSETLPKNSAALSSGLPVTQISSKEEVPVNEKEEETEEQPETEPQTQSPEEILKNEDKPLGTYIVLGIAGAIFIGAAYYFKVVKKKEEFLDEEDEEDDDFEELEEIEDEEEKEKDDFFKEETEDE